MKTRKAMSANEITEKCINLGVKNEITDERLNKVLEIQKKYLHNIAVYFDGGKFPAAPMYTREQAKIKVPFEVYTGKMQAKKEKLKSLKRYLQEYYDKASFGLPETRRRNMILLRWDIRKLERELQNA